MKKMIRKMLILSLLSAATLEAHAALDEDHILKLTVINETQQSFQFESAQIKKPGTHFSLDKQTMKPGEVMLVTAETEAFNDISGVLIFSNKDGGNYNLKIVDPEGRHFIQPEFFFGGANVKTQIISRTRGPHSAPRNIVWSEAVIKVVPRG